MNSAALDRWITGNDGEDSIDDTENDTELVIPAGTVARLIDGTAVVMDRTVLARMGDAID